MLTLRNLGKSFDNGSERLPLFHHLDLTLAAGEITPAQAVLELVVEWDADVDLDTDGVETALQHQIGLDTAIIHGYAQAIQVARKGN